jgi:flagellum-specific peptidoglycan hydrolase FlgJ
MIQLTNDPDYNIQLVIDEAHKYFDSNPVIADLAAAQAILESRLTGSNPSQLAVKYNNLFGIKGIGTDGRTPPVITHEYYDGEMHEVHVTFAANNTLEDSFAQYALLLGLPRYVDVWACTSFAEAANAIKEDGYATDPAYPNKLIQIYNEYINENT